MGKEAATAKPVNTSKSGTAEAGLETDASADPGKTPTQTFIDRSAAQNGLQPNQWLDQYTKAMNAQGVPGTATDAASFDAMLDRQYKQPGGYDANIYDKWKNVPNPNKFFYDVGWQRAIDKADWQTKEMKMMPVDPRRLDPKNKTLYEGAGNIKKHLADHSWVDEGAGPTEAKLVRGPHDYINGKVVPFIARHDSSIPIGLIFKLSDPAQPDKPPIYAMVMDRSPEMVGPKGNRVDGDSNRVEASGAVTDYFGYKGGPNGLSGEPKLKYEYIGPNGMPKMQHPDPGQEGLPAEKPTWDSIQKDGAKQDPNAPDKKKGAYYYPKGLQNVVLGPAERPLILAGEIDTSGGAAKPPTRNIVGGPEQREVCCIDDPTTKDLAILTGGGHGVEIG